MIRLANVAGRLAQRTCHAPSLVPAARSVARAAGALTPPAVAVLVGAAVWAVFRPGIMCYDGIGVYQLGRLNVFADWQPVAATVVVAWLGRLGADMAVLTLVQSCLVTLGVQGLAATVARTVGSRDARPASAGWVGLAALLVLLVPLSPLLWYVPYFGSDAWLLVTYLFAGWAWLRAVDRFPVAGRRERHTRAAGLVALAAAGVLIRPNAVFGLPVFVAMLAVLFGRPRWKAAAGWAVVLLAAWPAATATLRAKYKVVREHPEDQLMALDLVSLAHENEEVLKDLPYTRSQLIGQRYKDTFEYGEVGWLFSWAPAPLTQPTFVRGAHEPLAAEYREAVRKYPATLAVVKLKAFLFHLLLPNVYWHIYDIDPNDAGLVQSPTTARARSFLRSIDEKVQAEPVLRWVSGRHLLWLVVNLAGVAWLGRALAARRTGRTWGLLLLLGLALSYYSSFLLATVALQFRYMYPATLLVQVVVVTAGLCWAGRKAAEWGRDGEPVAGTAGRTV